MMIVPKAMRLLVLAACLLPVIACGRAGQDVDVGYVRVLSGKVTVTHAGQSKDYTGDVKVPVVAGDVIATGADSEAVVNAAQQRHLLRANSELKLDLAASATGGGANRVSVLRGLVTFWLPPAKEQKTYKFQASTGTVVAAVRGTTFSVEVDGTDTKVYVASGFVDLFGPGTSVVGGVAADGSAVPTADPPPAPLYQLDTDKRSVASPSNVGPPTTPPAAEVESIKKEILLKGERINLSTF